MLGLGIFIRHLLQTCGLKRLLILIINLVLLYARKHNHVTRLIVNELQKYLININWIDSSQILVER